MPNAMAARIKAHDPQVNEIFGDGFRTVPQWQSFLMSHFGYPPSLQTLMAREPWTRETFQALYVACWVSSPVEKGSYMITLDAGQRASARTAWQKLNERWSSHLSGEARSAAPEGGTGWQFLRNFKELLVQIEGNELFLKSEGHRASASQSSVGEAWGQHVASFLWKRSPNETLHQLGHQAGSGITARAAEGYEGAYKKLVKKLGLASKVTTVSEAIEALWRACGQKAAKLGASTAGSVGPGTVRSMGPAELAVFIRQRIVPTIEELHTKGSPGEFRTLAYESRKELRELADALDRDAGSGVDAARYFLEVHFTTRGLNAAFYDFAIEFFENFRMWDEYHAARHLANS